MSILNRPSDGLVSVLVALWRTLRAYGTMPKDQLLAMCAPPSVVDDAKMVNFTFNRWRQCGVFIENGDKVTVADEFKRIRIDDVDNFRAQLLRRVLMEENNPLSDDEKDDSTRASDFTLAAAWMMMQNPYTFEGHWEYVQELENTQGINVFSNSERWNGFKSWAPFLGATQKAAVRGGIVLNPVWSVRQVLPELCDELKSSRTAPAGVIVAEVFLQRLANKLPFVAGGQYYERVANRLSRPPRKIGEDEVAPCLSLALRQLRYEDVIGLPRLSDAPRQFALLGREGTARSDWFTHVEVGGQKRG